MSRSDRAKRKRESDRDGWGQFGGYMNAKISKLEDQFTGNRPREQEKHGSSSRIFEGVAIHVNGYTDPNADELKRLMMVHGGIYQHYYNRLKVTHIIATNLPASKIKEIRDKKIVHPRWITESITAGKLLPYQNYELYSNRSRGQQGLKFTFSDMSTPETPAKIPHKKVNFSHNPPNLTGDGDVVNACQIFSAGVSAQNNLDTPSKNSSENGGSSLCSSEKETAVGTSCKETIPQENLQSDAERVHVNVPATSTNSSKTPKSARDPNFLSEFYANSRLHYLSTWGAECRQYVNKLQMNSTGKFPGRERLQKFLEENRSSMQDTFQSFSSSSTSRRVIMHIDMDCFFVSVGLTKRPDLKGKPIAVTHSKGGNEMPTRRSGANRQKEHEMWMKKKLGKQKRGSNVISTDLIVGFEHEEPEDDGDTEEPGYDDDEEDLEATLHDNTENEPRPKAKTSSDLTGDEMFSMSEIASCSYEARQSGVRNGMFVGEALKRCPDLITIPYDFDAYKKTSQQLYDIISSYTHDVEAISCDEMFVDCTEILSHSGATPEEFAAHVRLEIEDATGCTASAGLASNILLSRLATRKAKPNGHFYLQPEKVMEFIGNVGVRDLPGVGWSTAHRLEAIGVLTCSDLQKLNISTLQNEFGPKSGTALHKHCRGIDERPLKMEKERKSVSAEVNYGIRFTEDGDMTKFLEELSKEVEKRLQAAEVKGRTITLKLKVRSEGAPTETSKYMGHGVCDNMSKSATLPLATDNPKIIATECLNLFKALKAPVKDLRGVGIQVHRLESNTQLKDKTGHQDILSFMAPKKSAGDSSKLPTSMKSQGNNRQNKSTSVKQVVCEDRNNGDQLDSCGGITTSAIASRRQENIAREEPVETSLPPLPTMFPLLPSSLSAVKPSLFSPVASVNSSSVSHFPSPSQIDPDVMKELPPDVQAQIKADMKAYQSKKNTERQTSQEPGCSHWDDDLVPAVNSSPITELPSFSQVDQSCLDALPDDIQRELKGAYTKKNQVKTMQLSWKPGADKSPSKSPRKYSPRKSPSPKKKSPNFKIPHGQPVGKRKAQAKRLDFSKTVISDAGSNEEVYSSVTHVEEEQPVEVNLCGAVELSDVKSLLKEWISSCRSPEQEDVERFIRYLKDLASDKNLERVHLILKFLQRHFSKVIEPAWETAVLDVMKCVQDFIKMLYGAEMIL